LSPSVKDGAGLAVVIERLSLTYGGRNARDQNHVLRGAKADGPCHIYDATIWLAWGRNHIQDITFFGCNTCGQRLGYPVV
jgi:hypothetical protein